jgi:hypothetical protein
MTLHSGTDVRKKRLITPTRGFAAELVVDDTGFRRRLRRFASTHGIEKIGANFETENQNRRDSEAGEDEASTH